MKNLLVKFAFSSAIMIAILNIVCIVHAGRSAYMEIELLRRDMHKLKSEAHSFKRNDLVKELNEIDKDLRSLIRETIRIAGSRNKPIPARLRTKFHQINNRLNAIENKLRNSWTEFDHPAQENEPIRHFPQIKYKVGVFNFEDKNKTKIGEAISLIMSKHILFSGGVHQLGVVDFKQGLSGTLFPQLTYFDKVEKITEGQKYIISIWGRVHPSGNEFMIDTFMQLSPEALRDRFRWIINAQAKGREYPFIARLRPNRIIIQSLKLNREKGEALLKVAKKIRKLKLEPNAYSETVANIPDASSFWIISRKNKWVKLELSSGPAGWTSVEEYCTDDCAKLLEASDFAISLMQYAAGRNIKLPKPSLSTETLAIQEQIRALDAVKFENPYKVMGESLNLALRWTGSERWKGIDLATGIDRGGGLPPGGAAFANIVAMAKIKIGLLKFQQGLKESNKDFGDYIASNKKRFEEIASDLARASLYDPNNRDILSNLALLYRLLNDHRREELALRLLRDSPEIR